MYVGMCVCVGVCEGVCSSATYLSKRSPMRMVTPPKDQHAATRCNTLHHAALHPRRFCLCSVWYCVAGRRRLGEAVCCSASLHCSKLQHIATYCTPREAFCPCSVFQCVAVRRHNATHCNTLQHTATHYNTRQHTTQHTAAHGNTLQHKAAHYSTLQHTAAHCNTLKTTETHCNATHCNTLWYKSQISWCYKSNKRGCRGSKSASKKLLGWAGLFHS